MGKVSVEFTNCVAITGHAQAAVQACRHASMQARSLSNREVDSTDLLS